MKDIGKLIATPTSVFEYAGEMNGKIIVAYKESVGSKHRLILKEVEDKKELALVEQRIRDSITVDLEKKHKSNLTEAFEVKKIPRKEIQESLF